MSQDSRRPRTNPVLFLDFDGVLKCDSPFIWHRPAIEALNHVLDAVTTANVVISSSWRFAYPLEFLRGLLMGMGVQVGFRGQRVIGVVGNKGDEYGVVPWLCAHSPGNALFAILDDCGDHENVADHWVHVDGRVALTMANAEKAVALLRSAT